MTRARTPTQPRRQPCPLCGIPLVDGHTMYGSVRMCPNDQCLGYDPGAWPVVLERRTRRHPRASRHAQERRC